MYIKVLGSAAGGGFPQWNCNYYLSRNARNHQSGFLARTQSSIIASTDKKQWVLFNASPDLRQQINSTPELFPDPNGLLRSTPISAVVLTNADIDHIAGLLTMRERQPFVIYATERVIHVLENNPVFNILDPAIVKKIPLSVNKLTKICNVENEPTGIQIKAFPVPGKIALFLEDKKKKNFGSEDEDTIGIRIFDKKNNRSVSYIPGCAKVTAFVKSQVENSDCLFFDGTLFCDDEMIKAGLGPKTGQRMGHMSISGEDGAIEAWRNTAIPEKIFIHINNSNPVLDDHSAERQKVEQSGWKVAFDGMELNFD
ncbi:MULTISPECIES: pyrroloquinoline quinone biosynthesis protein PqqB [Bartonella]|uniref:pyrroloquinoline quinone biosynthesis protein PqqB n=1 Tax=Bartonella TaxID=773 RepID=UPI0018DCFDDA|nr:MULTISPECIES: pyrroloquinoline quinone biosynthesis protein PqqB [Bartonella]MBH9975712.1 pyrroloquinoline quinone biosynthesis protein PqqB [Bartonella choladocola]MBI0015319.1 pyrroloquinoline quinone biosynthesis protein PqqB [Bartonella sp. B10834G3]